MMDMSNGIGRNIAKLRSEWRASQIGMQPHWKRFFEDVSVHSYVNLFVESRRISPYLWGHVDSILYPAIIVAIIWMFVK